MNFANCFLAKAGQTTFPCQPDTPIEACLQEVRFLNVLHHMYDIDSFTTRLTIMHSLHIPTSSPTPRTCATSYSPRWRIPTCTKNTEISCHELVDCRCGRRTLRPPFTLLHQTLPRSKLLIFKCASISCTPGSLVTSVRLGT